jgi:hypothetical protein
VLNGVLFAGINRLVLRPHEKGFAHLGFGLPEARQAAIWLLSIAWWGCSARASAWRTLPEALLRRQRRGALGAVDHAGDLRAPLSI